MYGLMVAFEPTRATRVSGGSNEGLNFGNVVIKSGTEGDGDHGSGSGTGRKLECWRCGGEHTKRGCPKSAKEKENKKNDGKGVDNKHADVMGGEATHHVHVIGGRPVRDRLQ